MVAMAYGMGQGCLIGQASETVVRREVIVDGLFFQDAIALVELCTHIGMRIQEGQKEVKSPFLCWLVFRCKAEGFFPSTWMSLIWIMVSWIVC